MKYYTKDWYHLGQRLYDTSLMKIIEDRPYSDKEIRGFYAEDLAELIDQDRSIHDSPPDYSWAEELLLPETFQPDTFYFTDEETGESFHPATPEIARRYLALEQEYMEEQFSRRPPFDPTEYREMFREMYRNTLLNLPRIYPQWVLDAADKRLLALNRAPEHVIRRLQAEGDENRRQFEAVRQAAWDDLRRQDIPDEIRCRFNYHDSCVLSLKKNKRDLEMILWVCFLEEGCTTPYEKVIFQDVFETIQDKRFSFRPRLDRNGEWKTNCNYIYDELYRTERGYEVHMLLSNWPELRDLTVHCADIRFEQNYAYRMEEPT